MNIAPQSRGEGMEFYWKKVLCKIETTCMLSHVSHVQLFATPWTVASRLLCSCVYPGKKTRVGCHALLQGIFLTQGSNLRLLRLLHWQAGFFPTRATWEAP